MNVHDHPSQEKGGQDSNTKCCLLVTLTAIIGSTVKFIYSFEDDTHVDEIYASWRH